MKKILFIIFLILISIILFKEEDYVIPDEAIRFRVISNSNNKKDIQMKQLTVERLSNIIKEMDTTSAESTRESIKNNLTKIEDNINNLFKEKNYDETFIIRYGINEFPEKTYKKVKYNAGYYESLVVEIGKAKGNNYWCVLYPPLCLIDEENEKIEYKSKVIEIIKKYIN